MNYRHAFHAGNFADLVKHAALLQVLARLTAAGGPLAVIDTHAGRGLYDLQGAEAKASREADAGVGQLLTAQAAPAVFDPLRKAVTALNRGGAVKLYPGSPRLIAEAIRPGDRYLACELRADEHAALREALKGRANVRTRCADGYEAAKAQAGSSERLLLLIDPPFEQSDDYPRIVETTAAALDAQPAAVVLVWLPLKDLATFDAFLGDLADHVDAPALVAEARVRPLTDPMKMNGCALVLANPPPGSAEILRAICDWVAGASREGGEGRVYPL